MTQIPSNPPPDSNAACLLYDGACPICNTFAGAATKAGQVMGVDARASSALRDQATAAGLDLDVGIVVAQQGKLYYGAQAVHFLAKLAHTGKKPAWLRVLYLPFKSRRLAALLYPLLVKIRRLLLWVQGKELIGNLRQTTEDSRLSTDNR